MQMRVQTSFRFGRRLQIAGVIVVVATAVGCSHVTGSKSGKDDKPLTCTFIVKLDQIASTVAATDVHNPETFKRTLDAAVKEYVENVRSLRAIAPADLHGALEKVEADVQQYRFDAALTDRAALDAYAQRTCNRVTHTAPTTVTGVTGATATTSTSAPGSATTVVTEPTTTTVPSDG